MIKIKNLTKQYKTVLALNGIDLNIEKQDIFGLLGYNGAGKSTLIKILVGLVKADSGSILINDISINNNHETVSKHFGYLPEFPYFFPNMTATECIKYLCKLENIDETSVDDLIESVGLEKQKNKKLGAYSQGMMQRFGLATALLGNPELLILDEPTNGLDPGGRKDFRATLKRLNSEGKTILLSSHLLNEIELVCNKVAVINNGEIIKIGDTKKLINENNYNSLEDFFLNTTKENS
ncbi:MAG: ABC transporter ATP-binding protein [Candidatus Marinimicrobia bacterium]|nr:ABC transporter ATP-binding protein [Candidatus Neomarinimicrobiota bacterium]